MSSTKKYGKSPKLDLHVQNFRKKDQTIKGITLAVACIIIIAAGFIIPNEAMQNGEKGVVYYKGKVMQVQEDTTVVDEATEGVRRGSQKLLIKITEGPDKGKIIALDNYLSALYNIYAKEGTKLVLRATMYEEGTNYSIYNYDRTTVLYGFVVLFILVLCVIGGKKGLMALLGLLFTLLAVIRILLPLLIKGHPAVPITLLLIIVTTIISFILLDGINKKTIAAAAGTIAGVVVSGGFAYVAGMIGHISGFQMEEAESLLLIAGTEGIKIKNLLVCGVLIASLGAVMDVAMSIASSIHELQEVNHTLSRAELFHSGMNIGKDAMGTMANTLILAFTGSSLNLLLMIYSYGIPYSQLINTDIIAIEIIKGIAGSIGIVLTVPFVAFVSSRIEGYSIQHHNKIEAAS
ncbi:hypothetical protein acsn021_20660 [Anaerocolumna cellulosilytica]|uniref:Uncharacterized protein n=1 Tax=Anaerocolumna cellulosilytica TaxID=433286 RepID=A0A6S6R357_9FIRM|nr:YibE/F family protein [Anaerocolumna cellulosilytica]MBB5194291.1 putative membrane protein [Anaerocolumna cellulosilytica]BCJ94497.1 hypothetical protein acsn021_20660 [Anaerocolumna cellulosilytica]